MICNNNVITLLFTIAADVQIQFWTQKYGLITAKHYADVSGEN